MTGGRVLHGFQAPRHDHAVCVARAVQAARGMCERRGLRLTALRRRVLELVWSGHGPMRAYDILDRLREERRGAVPPTVYRALDFLVAAGLVHRIESLSAYVGCGAPGRDHVGQFLICRACDAVAELDDPAISRTLMDRTRALGFQLESSTIEIRGLCPTCRAGAESPAMSAEAPVEPTRA
jgi:Fur family zinc uptake transcriptional regulator